MTMKLSLNPHPHFDDAVNWISGTKVAGSGERADIMCPWSGQPLAQVVYSTTADVHEAIADAKAAFPAWRDTRSKSACK